MNPLILLPFIGALAVAGLVAFYFREGSNSKNASRLDILVGKRRDEGVPDLLKRAEFDGDRQQLFEFLANKIPNVDRYFEQADCNIRPGQLFLVSMIVALLG